MTYKSSQMTSAEPKRYRIHKIISQNNAAQIIVIIMKFATRRIQDLHNVRVNQIINRI